MLIESKLSAEGEGRWGCPRCKVELELLQAAPELRETQDAIRVDVPHLEDLHASRRSRRPMCGRLTFPSDANKTTEKRDKEINGRMRSSIVFRVLLCISTFY